MPLLISGALHLALAFLFLVASSTLFTGQKTEEVVEARRPTRLVFLLAAGPGGGGGGGGQQTPQSPTPLRLKAPARAVHDISTPIRIARRPPRPPEPDPPRPTPSVPLSVQPPKRDPPKPDPPKPPPAAVQAPVAPKAADSVTAPGVLDSPTATSRVNAGSGMGEGAGSGSETGIGSGRGAGLGPGAHAGIGGGPFQAGSDIQPPRLLREVKPLYTEEARKGAVQGSVVLDVVVRRDGSVGSVAVVRSLGAGLEERAIDAVRQWRFAPAERRGAPVDVQVQVSVQFTLR